MRPDSGTPPHPVGGTRPPRTEPQQPALVDGQERRSLRLWSQQFNEEAERREQELRAREIKLAEREAGFEAYTAEVESREKSLATEWESLRLQPGPR